MRLLSQDPMTSRKTVCDNDISFYPIFTVVSYTIQTMFKFKKIKMREHLKLKKN